MLIENKNKNKNKNFHYDIIFFLGDDIRLHGISNVLYFTPTTTAKQVLKKNHPVSPHDHIVLQTAEMS